MAAVLAGAFLLTRLPALSAAAGESPRWWSVLSPKPLADLALDSGSLVMGDDELTSLTLLPEPWRVRRGSVLAEPAIDPGNTDSLAPPVAGFGDDFAAVDLEEFGASVPLLLKARNEVQLCAGDATWSHYVVTAEVLLSSKEPLRLSVANSEDDGSLLPGHALTVKAATDDTAVMVQADLDVTADSPPSPWCLYRLRPDLRWLASVGYTFIETPQSEESIQKKIDAYKRQESRPDQYWNTKWLRLRVEVTPRAARLWLDGVLMGWTPTPERVAGPMCLELHQNDRVRLLTVQRVPPELDGFVPLDLKARFNNRGLGDEADLGDDRHAPTDALPPVERCIRVAGIPFVWSSGEGALDNLDTSPITVVNGPRYIQGNVLYGEYKRRVLLRVPSRQYNELAVIAVADTKPGNTGRFEARMFISRRAMWVGAEGAVPAWDAAASDAGEAVPLPVGRMLDKDGAPGKPGRLWLIRIPLDPGTFQNFIDTEGDGMLDFDLCGTRRRAGVHILAATLVESPVQMKVGSGEIGHIFVKPQTPAFEFALRNATPVPRQGHVTVAVGDFYGKTNRHEFAYSLPPWGTVTVTNEAPCEVFGHHDLDVRLLDPEGRTLIRRRTTFAWLPADTRQAERDSPFGLWTFNAGHYGAGAEASGELLNKLGARYSHHYDLSKQVYGSWYSFRGLTEGEEPALAVARGKEEIQHWTLFAESSLGAGVADYGRFPRELLEDPKPLVLPPAAEAKLARAWDSAIRYSETVRKHHPEKKLVFGNGYPQFIISFLERGYPRRYLDGLALDFVGDRLNMFYYLGEVARHYGYDDVPFFISEGFYVGSGRGFQPDRQSELRQSNAYIKGFLRGLALGIERFLGSCEIWDNGGDYYLSGYGPVGLCHRAPETNPKPGFAAYATMTRLLDRAPFHSVVPTGSLSTYLLRFDGREGPVYATWTARGRRSMRFAVEGTVPCLTDSQCNDSPLTVSDGCVTFDVDDTPVWVRHAGPVSDVRLGPATYEEAPPAGAQVLHAFVSVEDWLLDTNTCDVMVERDISQPTCVGRFTLGRAEGRAPGSGALAVTLESQPGVSDHRLRYAAVRPTRELEIPAEAEALGVWLHGNGAATVAIELRDAEEEIWHSIAGRSAYSFGMNYAEPCAFDGWRYVRFELPPKRHSGEGNAKPDTPFTLSGFAIEQFAKVLVVNHLEAPANPTWRIGDIVWEPSSQPPTRK